MKRNRTLYGIAKALICLFMLFSAYFSFTHAADFAALGFPNYFRIELSVAKVIGAVILLVPKVRARVKEWIYAGFGITLFSALVAHIASGDPVSKIIFVSVDATLFVLAVVYVYRFEAASRSIRSVFSKQSDL